MREKSLRQKIAAVGLEYLKTIRSENPESSLKFFCGLRWAGTADIVYPTHRSKGSGSWSEGVWAQTTAADQMVAHIESKMDIRVSFYLNKARMERALEIMSKAPELRSIGYKAKWKKTNEDITRRPYWTENGGELRGRRTIYKGNTLTFHCVP